MENKKVKVPTFETIYKELDNYNTVDNAKEKGYNKNNMETTKVYNAFVNELQDIKKENGTLDQSKFEFLEKSYRHTAQQKDLNFAGNNKEFLRDVYNTFLKEDLELKAEQEKSISFSMSKPKHGSQKKTQSQGMKL